MKKTILTSMVAGALVLAVAPGAVAQDEWKFGIGTGFTSFGIDGDIGFPTPAGGVIFDVDLDNSDTSDLVDSGIGLGGFAAKGKWKILYAIGTVALEDQNAGLTAEWDRTQVELAGEYNFGRTGNHAWGVLFGVRMIDHEWDFVTASTAVNVEEDWTDALIGITHRVPINERWAWSNRLDGGFGDSEGSFLFRTAIHWKPAKRWAFNLNIAQQSIEFGDPAEIANADFYLYDVDEPAVGFGFLYLW
jgi:hypothetical protein